MNPYEEILSKSVPHYPHYPHLYDSLRQAYKDMQKTQFLERNSGGSVMPSGGGYDSRLFYPPSVVAIQYRYKHFSFQTWLDRNAL